MTENLRTPLARAKGLGAAKEGRHHWMMQRLFALALVPLTLWFLSSVCCFFNQPWQSVVLWASEPFHTTLLVLLITASFYHGMLGVQVVIEDYVHCSFWKHTLLLGCKALLIVLAVLSLVCIVKIFLLGFVI